MKSLKRKLTCLFLFSMNFGACGNGHEDEIILWPGTRAYEEKVGKLAISIEQAYRLLVSKTEDHPARYVYPNPIFIVGDDYFFTLPEKAGGILLQGFYVNGRTGVIEYRRSTTSIKKKKRQKLPKNAFTEIEKIN